MEKVETNRIIKALWIKNKGNTEKIMKDVREHAEAEALKDYDREITEFDKTYSCITAFDKEYEKIQERIAPLEKEDGDINAPFLLRWKRGTISMERLLNKYDKSIFILDENFGKYVFPEGVCVFGYRTSVDKKISICDENGTVVLICDRMEEVIWFAVQTCKYLLIGGKGAAFENSPTAIPKADKLELINMFVNIMKANSDKRIMALPGKAGCFANYCLKQQVNICDTATFGIPFLFVDSWADIIAICGMDKIPM